MCRLNLNEMNAAAGPWQMVKFRFEAAAPCLKAKLSSVRTHHLLAIPSMSNPHLPPAQFSFSAKKTQDHAFEFERGRPRMKGPQPIKLGPCLFAPAEVFPPRCSCVVAAAALRCLMGCTALLPASRATSLMRTNVS
jgi:hypothetical protein